MSVSLKAVWITGASSGIGRALAVQLARHVENVIVTARNAESLDALAGEYSNIISLPADLTSDEDLEKLEHYFKQNNVQLDAVVINAGNCVYMDKAEIDLQAMRKLYDVNLFAAVNTMQVSRPYLEKSAKPHVVVISSMSVYLPFTRAEYYGSSKAALTYFFKSLAVDLKAKGFDVSIVYPGFVDTPLTQKNTFKMPFIVSEEKAAGEIIKVMKKRPKEYAFPWQLHYSLKSLGLLPGLWKKLHKSEAWS